MSTAAPSIPAIDRASDWLNPILIKETRQALKSRQFVATFFLMLTASWLISVFGVVMEGAGAEYREIGGNFFYGYYIVLAVAVFLIVPFSAFRSLLSERDLHTWEVLSITTLKPREIVWGKLSSALLQIFIYYSAITPFMAFAKLLKGIDVPTIALVLVGSLVWSMVLSLVALTVGSFGHQRYWQVFLTLGVLIGLLLGLYVALALVNFRMTFAFEFDSVAFWSTIAVIATFLGAYCVLLLQIAIGQLTFDADNRTTGVRLAAAGVFWLALAWAFVGMTWHSWFGMPAFSPSQMTTFLSVLATMAAIHWAFVGLFTVTESDQLSRRVRRNLSRFAPLRLLRAPLLPGGARGYLYVIGHLLVLVAFVEAVFYWHGSYEQKTVNFVLAMCSYVLIYLGLGSALARLARKVFGEFRPAHARVLTMLLLAMGAILPQTLFFFDQFNNWATPQYWITDPFRTISSVNDGHADATLLMRLLAAGTVVVLALNVRSLFRGIVEVVRPTESKLVPQPALTLTQNSAPQPAQAEA
jgi:hypothetical protein